MKCFNIVLAATFFFTLTACKIVGAELTATNSIDADTAWRELLQAAVLPKEPSEWETNQPTDEQAEKFNQQQAAVAVMAANKAKDFYTSFPDSTNAIEAKKLQCKMLEKAFFDGYDTNVFSNWAVAQQTLLAESKLTGTEKFQLRVAIVQRKRFDRSLDSNARQIEREKDIREGEFTGGKRPR